jgi:NTE family protein
MDICLALGGGGSRGHAHIGVIRRLEQEGFHIRAVAGSSAGGIAAAVYAAGYQPDQMENIFSRLDQSKLFGRLAQEGPGLLGLSGASKVLEDLLGQRTFADLNIPCVVTAVDVKTGQEVVLNQGRVVDAVLATIALPGIFPPKEMGKYQLVDGGVLDPVPVSVARMLMPEFPVVAVVLSQEVEPAGIAIRVPLPVPVPPPIVERITRMRVAQAFAIFLQAVDAAERMLGDLRLQIDAPDVIIRPELGGIGLLDTVDVHRLVRLGEKAVEVALPALQRATAWPNRMRRKYFHRRVKELRSNTVV